jgi:Leucine-rich repeat (LRR) protein
VFPRVLRYLQKLVKFSIDDTPIDFLSENSVEGLSSLRELTLRNCSLERVPAALATIPHLETIDLSLNTIETISQI